MILTNYKYTIIDDSHEAFKDPLMQIRLYFDPATATVVTAPPQINGESYVK